MCFNRSVIGCINNLTLCSSGNAGTEVLNVHCMVGVIGVNGITLGLTPCLTCVFSISDKNVIVNEI